MVRADGFWDADTSAPEINPRAAVLHCIQVQFIVYQSKLTRALKCAEAMAKFLIALCQLKVTSDKEENITRARKSIEDAAQKGAKLVILPEMWNCPYSSDNFSKFAEDFDDKNASPSFVMLSEVARSKAITIVGGSIPERSGGTLYNACCTFGSDGELIAKHRKMHLFDVNMPEDICFKESDSFAAGDTPTVVDTDVGCIGIGICHDIRFPELSALYSSRGAQLICYPGAFNLSTGEALWELVQRARAADNQLFVATCSPSRDSSGSYMIWGHSMLVGPSGEVIAKAGHEECTVITEVNYSKIQRQRYSLPLEKQRRRDICKFIDVHQLSNPELTQ